MAKYTIIGHQGFIGGALAKRLGEYSITPTKETEVLFYMGSTVHPEFEKNFDYHFNKVIQDFLFLLPFCKANNIFFVYPSSALVYEKETPFSTSKKILEMMASCYPDTLGLRIFPTYGPGENRTVISQWCKAAKENETLYLYGDGEQARDFIFVDDAIDQILYLVENRIEGIRDIGTGHLTKFNDILTILRDITKNRLRPCNLPVPAGYSQGIVCANPLTFKTSIENGIKRYFMLPNN